MRMTLRALAGGTSALFGLAIAVAGSAGGAYAQPGDCGCVAAAGATGVVQSVRGNVYVSQATGSVAAKPNMSLVAGDSVVVGPESASTVRFGRNCTLRLRANTVFEARNNGDQLCLAVNEQGGGIGAVKGGSLAVPGYIAAGIGLGALAISTIDNGKQVSR